MSVPSSFLVIPTSNCDRARCRAGWIRAADESARLVDQELWLVWAGRGKITLQSGTHDLHPGSCVWMRPGGNYEASQDENNPLGLTFIHFHFQKRHLNSRHGYPELFDVWDLNYVDAITHRVVEIMRQGNTTDEEKRAAGLLLSGVLLDLVSRDHKKSQVSPLMRDQRAAVRQIIQHIYDTAGAPIVVTELARKAGYSPAHFSTVFKRFAGQSPESMIVQARIDRARRLLRWSSLPIGEVATAAGYPDVYFFSRQFKLKTGVTPTEYRAARHEDRLEVLHAAAEPVIHRGSPGAEKVKHGFEGGHVVKVNGRYHLFISEMVGDPKNVQMRLAYWTSEDLLRWNRHSTCFESSGTFDGSDPRAALWSPRPIYDEKTRRWNLFYVSYRSAENTIKAWLNNYEGRICRAVSETPGENGIAGPYVDVDRVLEPGPKSQSWEGLQGISSFFPYQAGDRWYAFYGSAQTEHVPCEYWGVGLATATSLAGPWKRLETGNPVLLDEVFVENPIVTKLSGGNGYLVLFDGGHRGALGYSFSADGIHWPRAEFLLEKESLPSWLKIMRTPLGAIFEDDARIHILFTGFDTSHYGCVGVLSARLVTGPSADAPRFLSQK